MINSLEHIRDFWHDLLDGDIDALRKVDEPTVKALELRAPRSSTFDAETIQSQVRGAQIFSAFNDQDRSEILSRLLQFKGLIPSLYAFFRNLCYWEACVDSIRHLVTVSRRDTIFTALERHFIGINQQEGEVVIQVDESNFTTTSGSTADQVEFGCRQIVAFAMRHFVEIPRAPVGEDILGKPRAKADKAVLHQYADLATRLGFQSPKIEELMKNPQTSVSQAIQPSTRPPLVTAGPGEDIRQRCGLPKLTAFEEDRDSLFLPYLNEERDEGGEGITSFFVRRWIYIDFLGRPRGPIVLAPAERGQGQRETQDREDGEMREREERERREREQPEEEQREWEAREREAREQERREQERREQDRREQERREQERREQERREQEELERQDREARLQRELEELKQQEQEQQSRPARDMVCIDFKIWENNIWRDVQSLQVDRSDPSEVARVAQKSMRKGLRTFDTNMQLLVPEDCFEAATVDGTNTILLVPQRELDIDDRLMDSANVLRYTAIVDGERSKRQKF